MYYSNKSSQQYFLNTKFFIAIKLFLFISIILIINCTSSKEVLVVHRDNNQNALIKIYIQYPDKQVIKPFTIRGEGVPGLNWDRGIELDHLDDNLWGIIMKIHFQY